MKTKDVLKAIGALLILVALVMFGWSLLTSMVKVFGDATSSIEPTIVVALISGLGAIIVNAISKNSDRKSQVFIKQKEKMVDVYESFLNELSVADTEENIDLVFNKYKSVFAVNSSDDTYNEFLALENNYKTDKNTERLVISIRNEMKVSNKKNKVSKK